MLLLALPACPAKSWEEIKLEARNGAPVGTRTPNQLIKSQLLYQLSYRGNR